MATCPAHEDRSPSLSVTSAETRVLVKCQAGCATDDVLAALNLTRSDLYDEPRPSSDRQTVAATYDYTDEQGTLLFQVVRTLPKSFRQRRPDGAGWAWNLNGSRRVLYRLPEVVAAVEAGRTVYVVEGEKDADRLASAGVVATTSPGGAGKWRTGYGDCLAGADVVVVADRDAPGMAHAAQVAADLDGSAASVRVMQAVVGKDASDHLAAGHGVDQLVDVDAEESAPAVRRLKLTAASTIKPQRVRWAWLLRMANGTLALLGGREGSGKSTLAYWIAARLTRGELPGEHFGTPRAVLVCATEDSWAHTIVPRLIAAGADLHRVYQAEVISANEVHVGLVLPRDIHRVEEAATETGAAMLLLDPLMSRIDAHLDTHRDGELRQALEPVAALADRTGLLVLGLIHFNKTGSTDVLDRIMGSKAFVAVARSVSVVVPDPDDESGQRRLFGTPKNNMGRTDLPSLGFTIESHELETDDGPTSVGQVVFGAETDVTVAEAMERIGEDPDVRTAQGEAKQWLREHLTEHGGSANSADVKREAAKAGHNERTLHRARKSLQVRSETVPGVMPRQTLWCLPVYDKSPWGGGITVITDINAGQSVLGPDGGTTSRDSYDSYDTPPREVAQTDRAVVEDDPVPRADCPSCLHQTAGPPGRNCNAPDLHSTGVLL